MASLLPPTITKQRHKKRNDKNPFLLHNGTAEEIDMENFPEIKLGFGCMRLPMIEDKVDLKEMKRMVDFFIKEGFNYFDTAHGYIGGKSELAIKEALSSRYTRKAFILTNKLTNVYFRTEADIRPFFQSQLDACGVSYFDFYLMHAQNKTVFEHFKKCRAYETALELKKEGKIRHFGISFHDTADTLDQILTEYPEIEVVQIQYNYLDYNDDSVQSRKCEEIVRQHGKRSLAMEPIKGGHLINLTPSAKDLLQENGFKPAELALRFAASAPSMEVVLSGMGSLAQMKENVTYFKPFNALSTDEFLLALQAAYLIKQENLIPCTSCRYCVDGCPKKISIPELFACMNSRKRFKDWNAAFYYNNVHTQGKGKASDCIKCGQCEKACPQKLPIRALLEEVAKEFEN